jgi:hypothetical protein
MFLLNFACLLQSGLILADWLEIIAESTGSPKEKCEHLGGMKVEESFRVPPSSIFFVGGSLNVPTVGGGKKFTDY